jgi:hypothetical protein
MVFRPMETQFIAALGSPDANSGTGAEAWGLWRKDPGPRGVQLKRFADLKAAGVAPAGWAFDSSSWWLEEHGLIMEAPETTLPPGQYLVTGGREAQSVLTVHARDASGAFRWELAGGTRLIDVTHLRCRSALYKPASSTSKCLPSAVNPGVFPVEPAGQMPPVAGCSKQDYAVLFVIGVGVEE